MFKLNNACRDISLEEILAKIPIIDLWRYYCGNFKRIDESFLSELYKDNNPSCRIFQSKDTLLYKDFGDGGKTYNVIQYIQEKYKCTFREALTIVTNDFNLRKIIYPLNKEPTLNLNEHFIFKPKSKIDIKIKPFNLIDKKYWLDYYIDIKLLEQYDVFACEQVYLYKGENTIIFDYKPYNPIYAYRFTNNGVYNYKIYMPLADKRYKWLSTSLKEDIEGFDQLDHVGNKIILTKSLKDVMVYRLLGYNAISLQGETNKLDNNLVTNLLKRYDEMIFNYDEDEEGIKCTKKLVEQYGFKHYFIDNYKDVSDHIKNEGYIKTKLLIDEKING